VDRKGSNWWGRQRTRGRYRAKKARLLAVCRTKAGNFRLQGSEQSRRVVGKANKRENGLTTIVKKKKSMEPVTEEAWSFWGDGWRGGGGDRASAKARGRDPTRQEGGPFKVRRQEERKGFH